MLNKLSETEMKIMQTIWSLESPVTVSQLVNIFEETARWKTSTISTLLARLIEKGYLIKKMKGKTNYYYPLLSKEEYQQKETQVFLKLVHGGSIKSFFSALTGGETLSEEEIQEIQQWFDRQGDNND